MVNGFYFAIVTSADVPRKPILTHETNKHKEHQRVSLEG